MIKQKEYIVCLSQTTNILLFKDEKNNKFRLNEMNEQGKRFIAFIEIRENFTELLKKLAIFEWEEKEKSPQQVAK